MIFQSKKNKLIEFKNWVAEITKKSNYKIELKEGARKHIKQHITNPINMKRIQKNIDVYCR